VNKLNFAHVVPMMHMMAVVVANHSSVVFLEYAVVNIRQIVVTDVAARISPGFTPNEAVASLSWHMVKRIENLFVGHD
jgi:hypothetical protein